MKLKSRDNFREPCVTGDTKHQLHNLNNAVVRRTDTSWEANDYVLLKLTYIKRSNEICCSWKSKLLSEHPKSQFCTEKCRESTEKHVWPTFQARPLKCVSTHWGLQRPIESKSRWTTLIKDSQASVHTQMQRERETDKYGGIPPRRSGCLSLPPLPPLRSHSNNKYNLFFYSRR